MARRQWFFILLRASFGFIMKQRKTSLLTSLILSLTFVASVLCSLIIEPARGASFQFIDRILRPCGAGATPYVSVITTSAGNIAMTTCVGGSVTINGVAVNAGGVTGTGTANTIPKFTAASTIGNSLLTDTGTLAYTGNGASGAAALLLSGTIFTGGGATNTKPQLLVEPNGATSTGWSNLGTVIGANAPSGFTGNLFDVQVNGVSKFKFDAAGTFTAMVGGQSFDQFGNVTASGEIRPGTTSSLSWLSRSRLQSPSDGVVELSNSAVTDFSRLQLGGTSSSFPAL